MIRDISLGEMRDLNTQTDPIRLMLVDTQNEGSFLLPFTEQSQVTLVFIISFIQIVVITFVETFFAAVTLE